MSGGDHQRGPAGRVPPRVAWGRRAANLRAPAIRQISMSDGRTIAGVGRTYSLIRRLSQNPFSVSGCRPSPGEIAGQLPVYGGASASAKALNPDISVIGDFLGSVRKNPAQPVPS